MVLDQPVDAVVRTAAFLIGGERHNDVAVRLEPLSPVADQICDPDSGLRLVVSGSAPVKKALLLNELKWVRAPVLAPGFDHIGMREKQERFASAGSVIAHYEIRLPGSRSAHED